MEFHDRTDVDGIHNLIKLDDVASNADLKEIEKKIINGELFVSSDNNKKSASERYRDTMNQLMSGSLGPKNTLESQINQKSELSFDDGKQDRHVSEHSFSKHSAYNDESSAAEENRSEDIRSTRSRDRGRDKVSQEDKHYRIRDLSPIRKYSTVKSRSNLDRHRTREQNRSDALKEFLQNDDTDIENNKYELEYERLTDDKLLMLEQIES